MANLFDIISQNRNELLKPASQTDETQRAQTLLRAKSGKAAGSGVAAGISNIGEQAANAATTSAIQNQVAPAAQIQDIQQRTAQQAQTQQGQQQEAAINQAKRFDNIQTRIQTQQILNDLTRDKSSLDLQKDQSRLEQASFLLSMQDKQYVDQLNDIGARRRLDNEANFNAELQDLIFGDQIDLLTSQLGSSDILKANDRQFKQAMSQMSIDDAIKMADIAMNNEKIQSEMRKSQYSSDAARNAAVASGQMTAQGLQGLLAGGLKGYKAYDDRKQRLANEEEEA